MNIIDRIESVVEWSKSFVRYFFPAILFFFVMMFYIEPYSLQIFAEVMIWKVFGWVGILSVVLLAVMNKLRGESVITWLDAWDLFVSLSYLFFSKLLILVYMAV